MTTTKAIISLLEGTDGLTAEEIYAQLISKDISIKKENLWSYLSTLKKNHKIWKLNDKKPYKYGVAMTKLELLRALYNLMSSKMDFKEQANPDDIKLIKQIVELI